MSDYSVVFNFSQLRLSDCSRFQLAWLTAVQYWDVIINAFVVMFVTPNNPSSWKTDVSDINLGSVSKIAQLIPLDRVAYWGNAAQEHDVSPTQSQSKS